MYENEIVEKIDVDNTLKVIRYIYKRGKLTKR